MPQQFLLTFIFNSDQLFYGEINSNVLCLECRWNQIQKIFVTSTDEIEINRKREKLNHFQKTSNRANIFHFICTAKIIKAKI